MHEVIKNTKMLYDTHAVNSMSSSSSYSPLNCKSSVNHKFRCVYGMATSIVAIDINNLYSTHLSLPTPHVPHTA